MRVVANSLPVTANPLEADSGAVATVSHKDSTTEGPGRHRARANRTSTTTTTTTNNDVDDGYRREDPDPAAEGGSLRRAGEGSEARAEPDGDSDRPELHPSTASET